MTTRDELLSAGYTSKGLSQCGKCQRQIETVESPAGRLVRLNPATDEERGGWLHQFSCGKDLQAEFEKNAQSEKAYTEFPEEKV